MLKKLLATVALISALVAPAYAGGVASDNTLPRQMTGTWCYDKELDSYLRQSCTDADVIVVKTDGYVNSSERCKFREVERVTDSLALVRGRCVQSSELAVGGKITPIGNNGGLKFELINNLQLKIRELPSNSILKSLSPEIQKSIKETRNNCIRGFPTEGDDGLVAFIVSGKPAVLVDELNLCVDENHRGMQYATGFSHNVDIYVRNGAWKKALAIGATDYISLNVDANNKFKSLVLSVHGGDHGCPLHDKVSGAAWKHEKCDVHVKWDGAKFVYRTLKWREL